MDAGSPADKDQGAAERCGPSVSRRSIVEEALTLEIVHSGMTVVFWFFVILSPA